MPTSPHNKRRPGVKNSILKNCTSRNARYLTRAASSCVGHDRCGQRNMAHTCLRYRIISSSPSFQQENGRHSSYARCATPPPPGSGRGRLQQREIRHLGHHHKQKDPPPHARNAQSDHENPPQPSSPPVFSIPTQPYMDAWCQKTKY